VTERNWSGLSPAEQLARCDERIAEYEAEGRWKSSGAWKTTKLAILQRFADCDGNIRPPKGDGSVTMSAEEIRTRNAQRRSEAQDRAAAEAAQQTTESGSESEPPRARSKPNGATHGGHRRPRVGDLDSRIRAAEEAGYYALSSRLKAMKVHQAAQKA